MNRNKEERMKNDPKAKRLLVTAGFIALIVLLVCCVNIILASFLVVCLLPCFYRHQAKCLKEEGNEEGARVFEKRLGDWRSGRFHKRALILGLLLAAAVSIFALLASPV